MDRYADSKMNSGYKYMLDARDKWDPDTRLVLSQAEVSTAIDVLIRTGRICELEAILYSFMTAWEDFARTLAEGNATPKQQGPIKGAFTHVINKMIEALLRNGVLLNCTPRETKALAADISSLISDVENKQHRSAMEKVIKLARDTEKAPRLRIDSIERYVHMLSRPGDFPNAKVPMPSTDTVSKYILTHLDPQRVVLAEQATAKRLPVELDKMQPEFGDQLQYLYDIVRAFNKPTIRRYAYCTAILHRANVWASRPLVQPLSTKKDPEDCKQEDVDLLVPKLPTAADLKTLGVIVDTSQDAEADEPADLKSWGETKVAQCTILGLSPREFEDLYLASTNRGKRQRAAEEAPPHPETE